ncbi:MAG: twin-arginine translocase subunit TatC [Caulobacteraceae bacterium]|nr:twin-arginine translocase subunit TatC [Caulobacter sp.]
MSASTYEQDEAEIEGSRAPLLSHLVELRTRLIICVAAIAVGFVVCFIYAEPIFLALVRPYKVAQSLVAEQRAGHSRGSFDLLYAIIGQRTPPKGSAPVELVFNGPLEWFFTKVKLAAFGAIGICFPVIAWQLYAFVAPGLYKRERRAFLPFLIAAPFLFVAGAALVYFVMLPFLMWFSLSQQVVHADIRIQLLAKVSDYMELCTKLILAFGLCFQLPVVLSLAGLAGLVNSKMLGSFRRYAAFGIVVVAALITPPDPFSQLLLALPIYLLYEISILCVRVIELRGLARERKAEKAATA